MSGIKRFAIFLAVIFLAWFMMKMGEAGATWPWER